jgi:hypothetical protein
MARGKMTKFWRYSVALLSLLLGLALAAAACAPPKKTKTPPLKVPSKVVTEAGLEFSVWGLKLPGSTQELKLKEGGSTIWLPLAIIEVITFTGPEDDRYRPADIALTSGEKLRGDLFVGTIIEGTTDLGYWNIQLGKVRQIGMGEQ